MAGDTPHIYTAPSTEDAAYLGTGPVPAGPYYRNDYFELEREAIFKRSWLQIGHTCELPSPGSYMVREVPVAEASILITRGNDDVIRAFHNVCPHRGTQLVSDSTDGTRTSFTCPYHAWTFNSDGRLRSAPDFERFYVDKFQCNLPAVALEICAGLIFINLDRSPARSLRESIGELADQLDTLPVAKATTFSEYVYEIDANWKLTYATSRKTITCASSTRAPAVAARWGRPTPSVIPCATAFTANTARRPSGPTRARSSAPRSNWLSAGWCRHWWKRA